jgi:hypothetical protein
VADAVERNAERVSLSLLLLVLVLLLLRLGGDDLGGGVGLALLLYR